MIRWRRTPWLAVLALGAVLSVAGIPVRDLFRAAGRLAGSR